MVDDYVWSVVVRYVYRFPYRTSKGKESGYRHTIPRDAKELQKGDQILRADVVPYASRYSCFTISSFAGIHNAYGSLQYIL